MPALCSLCGKETNVVYPVQPEMVGVGGPPRALWGDDWAKWIAAHEYEGDRGIRFKQACEECMLKDRELRKTAAKHRHPDP